MTRLYAARPGVLLGVVVLGLLLFWLVVLGVGAQVDGYSAREDYISSLASRGSPVYALGVAAFLASAAAQLATALAVGHGFRARWCACFIAAAAGATVVVALFRASCPDGPPRCALSPSAGGDWVDAVHGLAVGVYELLTLAAMLALAWSGVRRGSPSPRWLGWASLGLAVGSVALIGQTEGDHLGLWQRLWLANNHVWLLAAAGAAFLATSRPSDEQSRSQPDRRSD